MNFAFTSAPKANSFGDSRFKRSDQWIITRAISSRDYWISPIAKISRTCVKVREFHAQPTCIPGYDREKLAREGELLLASSRRDNRALLAGSNPREDVSARYLHTIRRRGPTAVQESAESGRPVSFSACLPSSSSVRCDASRSSRSRAKAPLRGIPSFRFLLPVPDAVVPRGPTAEAANSSLKRVRARERERSLPDDEEYLENGKSSLRQQRRAKGAARSRTQQVLLRPTGEPCQRFTASGVSHWYPAEGNRCDDAARYQERNLLLRLSCHLLVICCPLFLIGLIRA